MIQLNIDRSKGTEQDGYLTVRDGKRGVVRFTREEARDLADFLSPFQSPK